MIKIELEEWQVKNLRNYFGENSKTQTEHWAYVVFDKALKEQCNITDVVVPKGTLCDLDGKTVLVKFKVTKHIPKIVIEEV